MIMDKDQEISRLCMIIAEEKEKQYTNKEKIQFLENIIQEQNELIQTLLNEVLLK